METSGAVGDQGWISPWAMEKLIKLSIEKSTSEQNTCYYGVANGRVISVSTRNERSNLVTIFKTIRLGLIDESDLTAKMLGKVSSKCNKMLCHAKSRQRQKLFGRARKWFQTSCAQKELKCLENVISSKMANRPDSELISCALEELIKLLCENEKKDLETLNELLKKYIPQVKTSETRRAINLLGIVIANQAADLLVPSHLPEKKKLSSLFWDEVQKTLSIIFRELFYKKSDANLHSLLIPLDSFRELFAKNEPDELFRRLFAAIIDVALDSHNEIINTSNNCPYILIKKCDPEIRWALTKWFFSIKTQEANISLPLAISGTCFTNYCSTTISVSECLHSLQSLILELDECSQMVKNENNTDDLNVELHTFTSEVKERLYKIKELQQRLFETTFGLSKDDSNEIISSINAIEKEIVTYKNRLNSIRSLA